MLAHQDYPKSVGSSVCSDLVDRVIVPVRVCCGVLLLLLCVGCSVCVCVCVKERERERERERDREREGRRKKPYDFVICFKLFCQI